MVVGASDWHIRIHLALRTLLVTDESRRAPPFMVLVSADHSGLSFHSNLDHEGVFRVGGCKKKP